MKNSKRVEVRMDIRTSVNYAEVQLLNKVGVFFVDTEFGRVCIEANPSKEVNPVRSVSVVPWSESPNTIYTSSHSDEAADYYMAVDIYGSMITDHLTMIEGFMRCMFMNLGFTNVDEAVIDAATYLYVASYDPYSVNINMIEREFRKNHLGRHKNNKVMNVIIRELFLRKIQAAERVYHRAEKLLVKYLADERNHITFYDEFCKELFGIILYANNEAKEDAAYSYRQLLEYESEINVDRSTSVFSDLKVDELQ